MIDFAADLPAMYRALGAVSVAHTPSGGGATTTALALFDQPGQAVIGGDIVATDYSLRYPAASFPAIHRGDAIVVAGITYTVREDAQPTLDGLEMLCPLKR